MGKAKATASRPDTVGIPTRLCSGHPPASACLSCIGLPVLDFRRGCVNTGSFDNGRLVCVNSSSATSGDCPAMVAAAGHTGHRSNTRHLPAHPGRATNRRTADPSASRTATWTSPTPSGFSSPPWTASRNPGRSDRCGGGGHRRWETLPDAFPGTEEPGAGARTNATQPGRGRKDRLPPGTGPSSTPLRSPNLHSRRPRPARPAAGRSRDLAAKTLRPHRRTAAPARPAASPKPRSRPLDCSKPSSAARTDNPATNPQHGCGGSPLNEQQPWEPRVPHGCVTALCHDAPGALPTRGAHAVRGHRPAL